MVPLRRGSEVPTIFAKAVIAFLALPGIVAYALPLAWAARAHLVVRWPTGLALVALGSIGLMWCVRDFFVAGKGTLAPWAPPRDLVVIGLYRFTRNPMYVCVFFVLLGWAAAYVSPQLLAYALAVAVAFHLRVVFGEEPWLAHAHGVEWERYIRRVPRWFLR